MMPCFPGMPERVNDQPFTGCRPDCLHRASVEAYREMKIFADETRKIRREKATGGHATEGKEWDALHPPFTFKQWLVDNRRPNRQEPAA